MTMMEKLEKLLAAHKEAIDLDLEDNTVRIAKIQSAFVELKKEAILVNKESVQKKWHFPDLEKVFLVSKILSPTEGHWETLIIKALYFPTKMSGHEIFEIGRFTERMFSYAADNDFNYTTIVDYKRAIQYSFK